MLNLAVQDACKESRTLKALDLLHAVVNFVKNSPKRDASFSLNWKNSVARWDCDLCAQLVGFLGTRFKILCAEL